MHLCEGCLESWATCKSESQSKTWPRWAILILPLLHMGRRDLHFVILSHLHLSSGLPCTAGPTDVGDGSKGRSQRILYRF